MKELSNREMEWTLVEQRLKNEAEELRRDVLQKETEFAQLPPVVATEAVLSVEEIFMVDWDEWKESVLAGGEVHGTGDGTLGECESVEPPPLPAGREHISETWHYEDNGEAHGPVSEAVLKALWQEGRIYSDTLVWRKGMESWKPWSATTLAKPPPKGQSPS